jgi:restriction system protein
MDVVHLLGVSALVGAVGACLLIGLARFSSTWKAAKGNAVATKLIDRHIEALYRRRRTILIPDDYGVIRNNLKKEWEKEKTHFIQNVVHPELVRTGRRSWIPHFSEPLFGATLDQKLAAYEVDRPEDAEITGPTASGTDYEHLCAALLRKAGWSTQMTKGSGDQGADVIAKRGGRRIVVQCKFYSKPVGNKAVQEVVAAKQFVGADLAIVASNQSFTGSARKLAAANAVLLLHHDQLATISA